FWFEVRRRLEANVGPVVLNADVLDEGYSHVFDGFHTYIYLGDNVEEFYEDTIERFESGFLSSEEEVDEAFSSAYSGGEVSVELKPFSLTVIPGVDCTAIGQDLFLDRKEGGLYAKYWKAAIELEAHSVLITTWNEWHEGTEIEPSKVYGFDYINMTRRFIEEYKQTSIPIPKANFSATVESLTQHPDLKGDGSIVLAAAETPALYVNVSVSGKEGVLSLDLEGDFCIYLKDRKRNRASIVIPSVPPQSELAVRAVYEAESIRPLLNISVTAYDVSGRLYELYKGQLRPVGPSSITASVSSESIEIGQSITGSGSLSPEGEGRPIILFYTKPDSSTLTRTGTTAADGSYSDTFNPDTVGTWRVQASWEGDEEFEGKTSQVIFFTVRKASTSVSIQTSQSQIIEGESITISGSINPAVSGAEVDIGFMKPDGSTFTGRSITSSNGSYGYSYTPTETGLWNIKASWKGNPKHQGASSTTASFTVIKKKGFIETPLGLATISVAILAAIITTILELRRKTWHHSKRFGQCTNTNYRGRCVPRN
nr:glycoside hydrolase family 99-like domain-containing protein [Candidatus Njordarchaeum guaymaensis]